MEEFVVLVDENDQEIGLMEKLEAHQKGLLHRAFSVLIFNENGEMLLQKRALTKYHSPGLWTNACCSHPRKCETIKDAAKRRLQEELGFSCEVDEKFKFIYKANLDNDLIEHELDYVLIGQYNYDFTPNSLEVDSIRWVNMEQIITEISQNPSHFTEWFKIIMQKC